MAKQPAPFGGSVEGGVDALLDVSPSLRQHLAHLAGHRIGNRVLALHQEVANPAEHVTPGGGRCSRPDLESSFGRADGRIDIARIRIGKPPNQIVRLGGIAVLEVRLRRWLYPLASDEVLEGLRVDRFADARFPDVERVCHRWPTEQEPAVPEQPPEEEKDRSIALTAWRNRCAAGSRGWP